MVAPPTPWTTCRSRPFTFRRTQRMPSRRLSRDGKCEGGNILILGLAVWLVACVLLLATASLTLLALERRELRAQADAIALEIADDLNDDAYYHGTSPEGVNLLPASNHVRQRVRELADPRVRVADPTGRTDDAVVVTLERDVNLAFVPTGVSLSSVTVNVTSRAHLRLR